MARDTLYFYFDPQSRENVSWRRHDAEGGSRQGRCALATLREQVQGARVVAFVDTQEVLLTEVSVPTRSGKRLRQAVPYLLEEHLATEVEGQHFAIGALTEGGRHLVAVVRREFMTAFQQVVAEVDLRVDALIPDVFGLPYEAGLWSVFLDGERASLRTAPWRGYTFDRANLPAMLPLILAEAGEQAPAALQLVVPAAGDEQALGEPPEAALELGVDLSATHCGGRLEYLIEHYDGHTGVNLLQGEFSRRERLGRLWRPWRSAAVLAAIWLISELGMGIAHYYDLNGQEQRLQAESKALFTQVFPGSRPVDMVNRMRRRLDALRSGGGQSSFVTLLAKAAPVLGRQSKVQVQTLRYKPDELDLELKLADLPALDVLKQQLTAAGLKVDIQTASSRNNEVAGTLRITEGGA